MNGCWCDKSIAKNFLVVFNGLFLITGGAAVGLGIFLLKNRDEFGGILSEVPMSESSADGSDNERELLHTAAVVLIVAGGIVFLVGLLGCGGICNEWISFLVVYIIFVAVLLVFQVAFVIVLFLFKGQLDNILLTFLEDTIKRDYVTGVRLDETRLTLSRSAIEIGWDYAQATFECCGANNYTDWSSDTNLNRLFEGTWKGVRINVNNAKVPLTCCRTFNADTYSENINALNFTDLPSCLQSGFDPEYTYVQGCYGAILNKLESYSFFIFAVAIVLNFVEVVQLVAAIYLCHRIRKGPSDEDDDEPLHKPRASRQDSRSSAQSQTTYTTTSLQPSVQYTSLPTYYGALYGNGGQYYQNNAGFSVQPTTHQFVSSYPKANQSKSVFAPQGQTQVPKPRRT